MRSIPGVSLHWPAMYKKDILKYPGKKLVDHFKHIHVKVNGWKDIGYHYIIHRDEKGEWQIYDGRPDAWAGAHSGTAWGNKHIGINVAYGMDEKRLEPGAIAKIVELIIALDDAYGFGISRKTVKGHREFIATQCPGDPLFSVLDQVVAKCNQVDEIEYDLPKGQATKKKQGEEEQISEIKIDIGNEVITGTRINSQSFLHTKQLEKLGFKVSYDKQTDTVIIRHPKLEAL